MMFRSEALRTRYIIRSAEPWPESPQTRRQPMGLAKCLEVVPVFRARSGLRMNGQGDLQDERKEQEAGVECTTTVHR